jgi:hypothetical protein
MQLGQNFTHRVVTTLLLALTLGARAVSAGSISLQWDANTEHDLQGYRVYIGTQSGVYSKTVDVGNTTTYIFNEAQAGQRYCFVVAAYSAGPKLGDRSAEVCTDPSGNQPPTLKNPGNQTSQVGAALTLQLQGSDPESSPITYSSNGLPTGLTLNTNTGFISGTPTAVGSFNAQATVSDGNLSTTQAFTWTISAALPGAATLLRPTGAVATVTPTFEWESVATATSYRLWVDDASTTDPKLQLDFTPAQAGCSTAGAVCHVNPGVALTPGRASWSVRASNASGAGPWSGAMDFTVPDGKAPTVAIVTPTVNPSHTTIGGTVAIGGTASDDQGVTQVTWTNNRGGSGTAAGTASWTAGSIALQGGSNIITVTARDAAGNVATDVLTVTRNDGGAPTLSIVTPTANATYSTGQATLNLAGTAGDDIGVTQVTWATDKGASGVAAGTTAWTIANVPLAWGQTVVTVTAKDQAGNSKSDVLTVTRLDATVPTIDITSPVATANHSTSAPTLALGGTAADNTGVTQVTWSNSKGGGGSANGTSSWSVAGINLQPGSNVLTVTAKDAAGNVATDTLTVTLTDAVAPTVAISKPSDAKAYSTTSNSVALGGSASDLFGVTEVRWSNNRGGAGVAAGTSDWSVPAIALLAGVNVVTVTARDAAGNTATDSISITSDSKAPVLAITSPAAGSLVTKADTVSLAGTATDDLGVTELSWTNNRGGSGVAAGGASWNVASVALQTGVNVITVTARDAAGNRSTASVSVTRDSRAPSVAIVAPTSNPTFVTNAATALRGTASDDASVTQVTWQNSRGGNGTAAGTTDWSIPSAALLAGANVITVTARDAAGNTASAVLTITLDTRAPAVSIVAPTSTGNFSTTDNALTLGGSATDDTGIAEVSWVNNQGGSGMATGTTAWSVAKIALRPGLNTVTVTAKDTAGNSSTTTLTVRATDVKAPGVRITGPSDDGAFSTAVGVINLEGSSSDDFGVTRVSWTSDRGASGVANGDSRWIVGGITLQPGVNVITVTARDAAGNASTDVARITFERGIPTISLTSPTTASNYNSASASVALTGVASDESGITRVTWSTDKGQVGVATGTTSWSIPSVTLTYGATTIVTVTAHDNSGNTTSIALNVTYSDSSAPVVKIYSPTTQASFSTTSSNVAIGGTASDNVGVTQVSWSNSQGGSGVMAGTSSWAAAVPLVSGATNVITVTARDAAGNVSTASLSVTAPRSATSQTTTSTSTTVNTSTMNVESTDPTVSPYESSPSPTVNNTATQAPPTTSQPASPSAPTSSTTAKTTQTTTQPTTTERQASQSSTNERPASPPVVRILAPTASARYTTTSAAILLGGTAAHASGIAVVRWATDQGDSGVAVGTTTWAVPALPIKPGTTRITVSAYGVNGDSANAVITVVRAEPLPKLSLSSPTADSQWTTGTATVVLKGSATDNVTRVAWSSDSGATGVATGTTSWAIAGIALQEGVNRITLTAQDANGRTDRQVLRITYRPRDLNAGSAQQTSQRLAGLE